MVVKLNVAEEMYPSLLAGLPVSAIHLEDRGDGTHDLICEAPVDPIDAAKAAISALVGPEGWTPEAAKALIADLDRANELARQREDFEAERLSTDRELVRLLKHGW